MILGHVHAEEQPDCHTKAESRPFSSQQQVQLQKH